MRASLALRQQMRDAIDEEIAKRTKIHQSRMGRLKTSRASLRAAGAPAAPMPLVMLAHGDSWFDYPLSGNSLSLRSTDIIAQLEMTGNINPFILNISHYGDATTDEMSWPKQERMIESLQNPANWMDEGKPDAILFSGGGNDIVGDKFCIFVDYAAPGATGLNAGRFDEAIGMVEASTDTLPMSQSSATAMTFRSPTVLIRTVSGLGSSPRSTIVAGTSSKARRSLVRRYWISRLCWSNLQTIRPTTSSWSIPKVCSVRPIGPMSCIPTRTVSKRSPRSSSTRCEPISPAGFRRAKTQGAARGSCSPRRPLA